MTVTNTSAASPSLHKIRLVIGAQKGPTPGPGIGK